MAKVFIADVGVYEGPAYEVATEDGPSSMWDCYAEAISIDGTSYRHLVPFARKYECKKLVERIRSAGSINTDHWIELDPPMSLEDKFALYAERENAVRHGLMDEADMYHGIP